MNREQALEKIRELEAYIEQLDITLKIGKYGIYLNDELEPIANTNLDDFSLEKGGIVVGAFRDRVPKGWKLTVEDNGTNIFVYLRKVD